MGPAISNRPHGVECMEYRQRRLDKIDRFELLIAGLVGAVIASGWHRDDVSDRRAWVTRTPPEAGDSPTNYSVSSTLFTFQASTAAMPK